MNMNKVFRLVNPVYDRNLYIFKVNAFTKQAKHEEGVHPIFFFAPRIQHVSSLYNPFKDSCVTCFS